MINTDCHIQGDTTENTQQSVKREEKEKISRSFVAFIFAWKQSFLQSKVQKSSTNMFTAETATTKEMCWDLNEEITLQPSFCLRYFFIFNN